MKFLVGYTGSEESKAAMALARDYAKVFNAKVIVITSMEGGAGETGGSGSGSSAGSPTKKGDSVVTSP